FKGIIDLAAGPDHIIDYKTGRSKRAATEIIRQALPAVRVNQVDVQPLLYLAAWRAFNSGPLQFQYFYCLANHRDIIEQREDPADNSITIHYIPHTFNEYLAAEPQVLGAASQGRLAFMEKAGLDVFQAFFKTHPLPVELQFDRAALLAASIHTALEEAITSALGKTNKTIVRNVEGVLKAAVDLRTGTRCEPHFFREDLDEFETIVTDALGRINGGLQDRFAFDPLTPDTCRDCEAASYCLRGQS
ncbi:PD-(D/E)XK nuclease family protein, partial [Planctomycetota bacterium]